MNPRVRPLLLCGLLLASACGSNGGGDADPSPSAGVTISASVASYDLAADRPQRFMVGIPASDGRVLGHGTVDFAFSYLGRTEAEGEPSPGPEATAEFLPVPGSTPAAADGPALVSAAEARGVYVARDVDFDRAGLWEVRVTARTEEHGELTATAAFPVLEEPEFLAPGDRAPRTQNRLPGEEGIELESIDSAAATTGELPDPHLHRVTIADAIERGRPFLAIFSTPVYCQSQFCGPVTDVVADIAREHEGDAEFVHVEVWKDFQGQVVNRAAAEWVVRGEGADAKLLEPWLYLVGADGRIVQRWDNLFDRREVEEALAAL